jgi:hypothetical protein
MWLLNIIFLSSPFISAELLYFPPIIPAPHSWAAFALGFCL